MINLIFESNNIETNMQHCTDQINKFLSNVSKDNILWSPKIDGVRTWCVVNKRTIPERNSFRKIADIKYLSRNNNEFRNFNRFNEHIIEMCHIINRNHRIRYPIIFDIEVSSKDKKLSSVMTQIHRINNMDPKLFQFNIFDIAVSGMPFIKRYTILNDAVKNIYNKDINLIPYKFLRLHEIEEIYSLRDKIIEKGYEGIVLMDKKSFYQFDRRTPVCLKLKSVNTIELPIIDVNIGKKDTKWEGVVSTLVCQLDDKKINISGQIDYKTRQQWAKNPPLNILAEIKYKEITNKGKLRDPVFIRLREEK